MDGSDRSNEEGSGPKPTPIRDVLGESQATPARRAEEDDVQQIPKARDRQERPKSARDTGRRGPGRGRGQGRPAPRPVRDTVERRAHVPTSVEDLPSCHFEVEGVEWIARLSGRTATGSGSDPGAPLLHLTFFKSADPMVAVVEALLPGESIDHLFESDLSEVLATARKVSPSAQPTGSSTRPGRR